MSDTPALLRRADLAAALTAHGFPITKATLETLACRGGGPAYRLFGRTTLYDLAEALDWARARLSAAAASASEHAARRAA